MRKRGVSRFIEVLTGNFRELIKLNLLFCLCALPSVAAFAAGFLGVLTSLMYLIAIIAAYPVGGAASAYLFCITKLLRDEAVYIRHDFKRKFIENIKQAAAPGILCAAFVYAQVFLWWPLIAVGMLDAVRIVAGAVFLLIFGMVVPYIFLQLAYIDLKTKQIIVNSVLMAFANAPHSLMGALFGGIIWIAFLLFLPESLVVAPLLLLFGFPASWLLSMMWVWPVVDKQFAIEETLQNRAP